MLYLIPYARLTWKTYTNQAEVEARLKQVVEPRKWMRWGFSRNHKPFEGIVENGRFQIMRIIHYNNGYRPIILGEVRDDIDATTVDVKMRLPHWAHALLLLVMMVVLAAMFTRVTVANEASVLLETAVIFLSFILFVYGVLMLFFNYEVYQARKALEKLFYLDQQTL